MPVDRRGRRTPVGALAASVLLALCALAFAPVALVGLVGLVAQVTHVAPAGAQEPARAGEAITAYDVAVEIADDGSLDVTEVITYRFPTGLTRRGIIRSIPRQVRYDDRYDRRYPIDAIRVSAEPVPGLGRGDAGTAGRLFVYDDENDNRNIRIGDEQGALSGTWRYTIDYRVGAATEAVTTPQGRRFDEVVWNAVGTEWAVPIEAVTVRVTSPAPPLEFRCFAGPLGSSRRCAAESGEGRSVSAQAGPLDPGEAVTVTVDLPPGTVPGATIDLVERWSFTRAFEATPLKVGLAGALGVAGGVGLARVLGRQARDRRLALNAYLPADRAPDTEGLVGFFAKADGPVRFRPPEGATPGLVGVVVDEKADPLDVSATIVDLAVRGYLRIEELADRSGRPRQDDFRLRRMRPPDDQLLPYEAELLRRLWQRADGADSVTLGGLRRTFAEDLGAIQQGLYDESMRRHWFVRRPDHVRAFWYVVGALLIAVGLAGAVLLAVFTRWGLLGIPLVVPGVVVVLSARHMPARTARGRHVLEEAVGYERFLDVADADQLRFQEEQHQFVAALPYAMVFGLTRKWAEVLAVLQERGLDVQPSWYVGYDPGAPFRALWLGAALSNFSSASSQAMSAMPASSGGGGFGGGGGFAGGGGGGGGGGSW